MRWARAAWWAGRPGRPAAALRVEYRGWSEAESELMPIRAPSRFHVQLHLSPFRPKYWFVNESRYKMSYCSEDGQAEMEQKCHCM